MTCSEVQNLLNAHLDGELDLVNEVALDRHVAGCEACGQAKAALQSLRATLSGAELCYKMPPGLADRLSRPADAPSTPAVPAPQSALPRRLAIPPLWRGFGLGTAFAAALFALWTGTVSRPVAPVDDSLATAVVASHVRALMANHLMDVPSTDQHTVKPWFNGRLDYSPPVQDFAAAGFPLVGGRLDYLDGRPVAALIYRRRRHFINLFVWPTGGKSATAPILEGTRQGYNLYHWEKSNSTYWVVSDLARDELNQFARLVLSKG